MQPNVPEHYIPRTEQFDRMILENRQFVADGKAAGTLPDYPVFVDRLFKRMPLVSVVEVAAMLQANIGEDGALDLNSVAQALQAMATRPEGSAIHVGIGLAGEGGEVLDAVKKPFVYGKGWHEADKQTGMSPLDNMMEELADHRFYYQKGLNMLSITDADVEAYSYRKLSKRYGTHYSDAAAQARSDKEGTVTRRRFIGMQPPAPAWGQLFGTVPPDAGQQQQAGKLEDSGDDGVPA